MGSKEMCYEEKGQKRETDVGLSKRCTFQVYLSDEEKSRSGLRNFWEIRAQNAPSLCNFCALWWLWLSFFNSETVLP
jgi:hypothetical protein